MPNWYTINHPTTFHTHNETVTHCCSLMAVCAAVCILQTKLPSLNTQPPLGSPRLTILSASPVRTLIHCVVKYSRPPDLKSSSNVSLPFAWITGPATDPSYEQSVCPLLLKSFRVEGEEKKSTLTNCRFTTVSSQIFAIYMNIQSEVQTVILRC